MMMDDGALADLKVLDLTWHITGPYCTKLLADFGAEVLKIERPDGGDPARRLGPFPGDVPHPERSGLFLHLNTNKQSLTLNLKSPTGRGILLELVKDVDLVVESFRPGVVDRLGLGYADLARVNPEVVLVSISNFGQTGPYRDYALTELLAYAMGGAMHATGIPEREPVKLGATVMLMQAGNVAAAVALGAYFGKKFQGVGQHVDLSIHEIMAGNVDRAGPGLVTTAFSGQGMGSRTRQQGRTILPSGVFPCADGYVQFSGLQAHFWPRFCRMLGRPNLISDPRVADPNAFYDLDLKAELEAEVLYPWLFQHTKQEIMEAAQREGFPGTAVNTMEDIFRDPHFRARGFFTTVEHPQAGALEYPGPVARMSASPARAGRAPLLGEHNEAILCGRLGYSRGDLVILRERGVL
ncbi:MAG: CoA transferase [Chloroflexi bacterium]|nr:CoA transferase [Chloroflexota bacterium]